MLELKCYMYVYVHVCGMRCERMCEWGYPGNKAGHSYS